MTTYLTEAFTGTTGANWNTSNWGTEVSTTGASATIQSNRGRLSSGSLTGYTAKRAMKALISNVADVEITGTFRFESSSDANVEVWVRAITGTFDSQTGYFMVLDKGNSQWQLYKAVNYTYTQIGSSQAFTFTQNSDYFFRFQVIGTTLKGKVWSGSEPGSWGITATDSSVAASNGVVIQLNGGASASQNVSFDDITITNGAGNAFTYTGSITPTGFHFKSLVTKAPFTGSTTATGAFTKIKVVVKTLTGSITSTGAFLKQAQKQLTGSITPNGLYLKRLTKLFTASISGTGAFRKSAARLFTASISSSGVFSQVSLGRVFGRPGKVAVRAYRAAETFVRVRRG